MEKTMKELVSERRRTLKALSGFRKTADEKTYGASRLMESLSDGGEYTELCEDIESINPLGFPGYREKLMDLQIKTGMKDSVMTAVVSIRGRKAAVGILDGRFLMGSMGSVAGEKIVRLAEFAIKKRLPLITIVQSGGARMQEGMFSLVQMARTCAAIERYKEAGGLYISYLGDPTTGGVSASFASRGDIIIAQPGALICFAGPRVIEQTIGEKLPEGFQRAEFLMEHGMVDMIVPRNKLRQTLDVLLRLHPECSRFSMKI